MAMTNVHAFRPISLINFKNEETIFLKWERFPFQDKRLERLWQRLSRRMRENQSAVVHRISKAWSEMSSFYRFLSNKRVKVEEMLYHSCKLGDCTGLDVVVLGDSSSYTLSNHLNRIRDAHRLGVVEDNQSAGYHTEFCPWQNLPHLWKLGHASKITP